MILQEKACNCFTVTGFAFIPRFLNLHCEFRSKAEGVFEDDGIGILFYKLYDVLHVTVIPSLSLGVYKLGKVRG